MSIGIAIVEDDKGLREAMTRLIERADGLSLLASFETAEEALERLASHAPQIVLMDINLPGMNGVDCVRALKVKLPATQVLMLTVYEDTDTLFSALAAGASGYLLKRASRAELLGAIKDLHNGGSPMTSHIARRVVQSFRQEKVTSASLDAKPASPLSPREEQVLKCLARGYQYKEIAEELGIGTETVRTHIRRIYEKLHARSAAEAVAKFLQE